MPSPPLSRSSPRRFWPRPLLPQPRRQPPRPAGTAFPSPTITARLTAAGLTVAPPQSNENRTYLRVDDGPLRWVMTLFSCTDGACPDIQFTAVFSGANATPEIVSRWNATVAS